MRVGEVVDGKYQLLRLIGEGGMGQVFEAYHTRINRRVALKALHPELTSNQSIVERFIREAQTAAAIGSEHIVDITDAGEGREGSPYLVMEYLEGGDLKDLLKREGPMAPDRAVRLILQVCEALGAAHSRGIVHRDLKPENLFLVRRPDGAEWVKVLDFGIAKFRDSLNQKAPSLTATGTTMGTPYYMAPEQFGGSRNVSERSDVYSTGVILYELLAGTPPFRGSTYEELVVAIATAAPAPLTMVRPEVGPGLDGIVRRAMARDPAVRHQSMAELHAALLPFATGERPPATLVPPPALATTMPHTQTPSGQKAIPMTVAMQSPVGVPVVPGTTPVTSPTMTPVVGAQVAMTTPVNVTPSAWATATGTEEIAPRKGRGGLIALVVVLGLVVLAGSATAAYLVVTANDTRDAGTPRVTVGPSGQTSNVVTATTGDQRLSPPVVDAGPAEPREPSPSNPWVRVAAAAPGAPPLGLSPESVEEGARGFRPGRGITPPTEPFDIQAHEVTWRELRAWLASQPSHQVSAPAWVPAMGGEDLPATAVPWATAQAFCESLGGSLPTEEQWEHAARGAERRPSPWGAEPLDPARTHAYRPGQPLSAVTTNGQDATPGGPGSMIYDMAGNALEWTASLYREDIPGQDESWVDSEGMTFRAVRGLPPAAPRPDRLPREAAAHRDALCAAGPCPPATAGILEYVGFRCVRPPQ